MTPPLLTARERQVLELALAGWGTTNIALHLKISKAAVSQAKGRLLEKGVPFPDPTYVTKVRSVDDWGETLTDLYRRRDSLNALIDLLEALNRKDAA